MAIEQNSTVTVGSGDTAKTFGISKSLNNYTIDELLGIGDWAYSAFNDSEMNANIYSDINTSGTMIDITEGQYASRVVCYPDNQLMSKGYNTNSEGVFFRNVLIYYDVTETNWASSSVNVDTGRLPNYYVVTDIDLQDLVINALSDPNAVASSYTTMKLGVNDVTIAPFQLYLDQNGELSLNMLLPPVGGRSSTINHYSDLVCYSVSYGNWSVYTASGGGGRNIKDQMPFHFFNPNHVDYPFQNSRIPGTQVLTDADKLIQCVKTDAPNTPARFHYQYKVELMDKPYIDSARCGIRFKIDDTIYKPIVEDGMITGYTDDDTITSEWDEWENIKDHVTPSERPVPPSPVDDDSYADMGIGVGTGVGGYTSFAIMTIYDLVDLLGDFNANLKTGMSVVNNFICLYKLGPLASYLCSTRIGNIIMSANASSNFVSVRADYNIVTNQKDVITLGEYNVPRMTNTFYDFSPYSTYELFIPCCGWVPLPDTVAGRKIVVYLIIDLSSCTCKGICRIDGTTVAEASGVLGVSVPFFSTDSGLKRAADVIAVTQMITGVAQGGVGAGSGAGALVVSGSANALQGLEQLYINGNTNYTAIKGGNGDITAVGNGEYCTIKITHPKVDEVVNNSRFGHSVGYLCNTVGKIKNFKGLTVCANPHVNGIECTESEKEEIKRLLEEGIIVN